jgi:hypothetical protein
LFSESSHIYDALFAFLSQPQVFAIASVVVAIVVLVVIIMLVMHIGGGGGGGGSGSGSGSESSTNWEGTYASPGGTSQKGSIPVVLFILAVIVVVGAIVISIASHQYHINVMATLSNLFSNRPHIQLDIKDKPSPGPGPGPGPSPGPPMPHEGGLGHGGRQPQVFNVPGNYYTYDQAKNICQAYGGSLATYDQLENAYTKGAEWCNYGWSANQMSLFPTQKRTWEKLQKVDGHEHDCGRPGINGGYMANPNLQFGVNCYALKPKINKDEEDEMKNMRLYPPTTKDLVHEQQVDYWKNHIDQLLLSPFNPTTWSFSS